MVARLKIAWSQDSGISGRKLCNSHRSGTGEDYVRSAVLDRRVVDMH